VAGLVVPDVDESWPTLGDQVADWIEANLAFGPGDLRGQPYRLDDEKYALLLRMYEIFPAGHPQEGRRRFKRCAISLRKGSAKTEFAAAIAAAELHPDAPVRFAGWNRKGKPTGKGVNDPYIPMVAYTEEQSEELAYGALRVMISEGPLADDFDVGLERIMRKGGDGKAVALASSPDSRDGARTTFQHFDETHRFTLERLKAAHKSMLANIPKRRASDAWSLETTTAPAPGENSVAESTWDFAKLIAAGAIKEPTLFFFHRQAAEKHDLTTPEGVRAAVIEASGPIAEWSDIDGIVAQFQDPTSDQAYLRRVWLNQLTRAADRAFDAEKWKALAKTGRAIPDGELITLGFDGSRIWDSTALVATHVASGFQWPVGIWQRPPNVERWEVDVDDVDAKVAEAFRRWNVWRTYADPPYWDTQIAKWAGEYGAERVIEWWTTRQKPTAFAVRAYANAIAAGELSHSGDALLTEHIGNAVRRALTLVDDEQKPLWVIQKERPDSPHKIDGAMAGVLSWEARNDAVAKGAVGDDFVYNTRGLLIFG
jgi:phage terminase large subunit-like protein